MALKVAARGSVPPFIVMDVLREANERAAAGQDVLHLEVGQPGTPAPEAVLADAKRALDGDRIGYTDALRAVRPRDRNGGFPRLSDGPMLLDGAQGLRCLASPRHALLAESLGKPSLWVIIKDLWYYDSRHSLTGPCTATTR